jgi:hypothetical protein
MVTDGDFTENEHQQYGKVPKRYALSALRKRPKESSRSCLVALRKYISEEIPWDGYPLGLPAGVAGGLSGKYLNHNRANAAVNRI